MGNVSENQAVFDGSWDWSRHGDEWSDWLGGTPSLWQDVLFPRLDPYLPAHTILEIAPGHGRVTQFLKDRCDRLLLVDLAAKCIDACRERFADSQHLSYYVNDGRSLDMIDDHSVDLVVSWDSLVHAELDIVDAYISQLGRILVPNGVAWIHHSNVAAIRLIHELSLRLPKHWIRPLVDRGVILDLFAWRAPTVSAARVAKLCDSYGLLCERQEVMNWEHGPFLTDAITIIRNRPRRGSQPLQRVRNRGFQKQARQRLAEGRAATST